MPTCPSCRTRYPDSVQTCEVDGQRLLPDEAFSGVDKELPAGMVVGEYKIEAKIGEGGFGEVYRAVHPVIGKSAAVKVLARQYSSNPDMVARFIDEARAVNQIRHRNIIDIFAFGLLQDGRHYFVMELLEGETLDRYVRKQGRLSPEVAIPLLRQIARALDAAHAAGIAHRDLKPENVFLQFDEDDHCYPKLLDFGIAKLLGDSARTGQKTRTGTPLGTPLYMSPEQCRGQNVDHRTDIYSFGIMVHESLTGQPPFDSDNLMDLMLKQTSAPAPPMSSVCSGVPTALDAPVLRMLAKEPAERPQSVTEAIDALAGAASTSGFAVPAVSRPGSVKVPIGAGGTSGVVVGRHMTPQQQELAEARTLVHSEAPPREVGKTFQGSESDVTRAKPRRAMPFIVGGLALALGAVGAMLVVGFGDEKARDSDDVMAKPPIRRPAVAEPKIVPDVPASAAASADVPAVASVEVTPEPASVEVSFDVIPADTEVWRGEAKLGTVAAPISIELGEEDVVLTLKRAGFLPQQVTVEPGGDNEFKITLPRRPAAPTQKKPTSDGELEF